MATRIGIVNIALGRLGENPIQSLDEGSVPANMAKVFYDQCRRAALREYPWSFALKEHKLTRMAGGTEGFYSFSYVLPPGCLRALGLKSRARFEVRSDRVLTADPAAVLQYVGDVEDEAAFDDKFVEAFSYKLASELAMPVKGSAELMANYANMYQTLVGKAAALTEGEGREVLPENPYLLSRGRYGNRT